MMLGFFLRRTGDPELTADLTAEVFAAALLAAERYRPGERVLREQLVHLEHHHGLGDIADRGDVIRGLTPGAGVAGPRRPASSLPGR